MCKTDYKCSTEYYLGEKKMSDIRLKVSPPWITHLNMIKELFGSDPDIIVDYDDEEHNIIMTINNGDKNAAIQKLLPHKIWYGNVEVNIVFEGPLSDLAFPTNEDLFNIAFDRNPALSYVKAIYGPICCFTYVVFKNCVVQFFNDNLNDIHGNVSTLYEDIAADLFEEADLHGVAYCTDIETGVGVPLGEWP